MIKWWLQPLWLKHLPKGHFLIHLLLFSCWVMSNSCDPMTCSTPGFPIFHYLPEFAQTHIHWVIDAIQPSQTPFSSCSQSFPAIGSFPMTQVFASGGQSIGASVSAIVFPRNIQSWFPLGLTGLISLLSKGLSRVFSSTQFKSINSFVSAFFIALLSHPYMTPGKTIAFTRWTFVGKVVSLLFNMLSRLVIWGTSHHYINIKIWSKKWLKAYWQSSKKYKIP